MTVGVICIIPVESVPITFNMKVVHKYYKNGSDSPKRADIKVELSMPSAKDMQKWTPKQREGLVEFIKDSTIFFNSYMKEIKKYQK